MSIKILYFGYIKEVFKKSYDIVNIKDLSINSNYEITYDDLCQYLLKIYNTNLNAEMKIQNDKVDFKSYLFEICLLAINDEFYDKKIPILLNSNLVISIIPPVSGG